MQELWLGPVQLEGNAEGSVFLGRDYAKDKNFSDAIALEIDKEVRKIIDECYENAKKILKENKKLVYLISDTLIEHETITKEEIDELVKTGKIAKYENETSDEVVKDTSKEKQSKENKVKSKDNKEE